MWILVRNASPTMYVLGENIQTMKIFQMKFSISSSEKNLCVLHVQVFVLICITLRKHNHVVPSIFFICEKYFFSIKIIFEIFLFCVQNMYPYSYVFEQK